MDRELRRVPADWQHPKHRTGGSEERYKPLYPGERYQSAVDEWDEECAKWKAGWRPDCCDDPESRAMTYEQYSGQRPHRDDYMPDWPAEQRTHLMMYETISEGTPISPAFETPEELARWLADTGATAFGSGGASYEARLQNGVTAAIDMTDEVKRLKADNESLRAMLLASARDIETLIEQLGADSDRLDWLQSVARCDLKKDGNHVWWPLMWNTNQACKGFTIRAAIDAARKPKRK